jgi:hypothetical protein
MKLKASFLAGLVTLAGASFASAQAIEINITGATAFRAAANNSILELLGGPGVTTYSFTGTSGLGGSNRVIFKGSVGGQAYIVRTSWSGSTQGILDLADQNAIQFLKMDEATVPTSTSGVNVPGGLTPDPAVFETAIASWSFSDVDQLLSQRPNAPLAGGPVGVVPFIFIGGQGAPAAITNMTDQIHNALWSSGALPASVITGNAADTTLIYATGRNNGSGTRATILAETQYGAFTPVVQFNCNFTGDRVTGTLTGQPFPFDNAGNGGNQSNSGVRELVTRPGSGFAFVSYLTVSDALNATGYDPLTNTVSGGEGARALTYNGVRYSEENVQNGAYSLWGYQQFYLKDGANAEEIAFDELLRNAIPNNMGTAGIPIPSMNVERLGGDGGIILPLD